MARLSPEERYREIFFERVKKECRAQGINCSMCYNRIHVYTKYEDFYFEPNPDGITLMHRNTTKDEKGRYGYHVQESCTTNRPEGIVKYIAAHTKFRYTEDGKLRPLEKKTTTANEPLEGNAKKQYAIRINRLAKELKTACDNFGFTFTKNNNFMTINNGYEDFCLEVSRDDLILRSKKCKPLCIKEAYNEKLEKVANATDICHIIADKSSVHNNVEYVQRFYTRFGDRCAHQGYTIRLDGNRIFVKAELETYYFDIAAKQETKLYIENTNEVIHTFNKDTNAEMIIDHICNIEAQRKAQMSVNKRKKFCFDWSRMALIPTTIVLGAIILLFCTFFIFFF